MKDVIIALVLFSLLIAAIILNSFFVLSGTEDMLSQIDTFPVFGSPECASALDELKESWISFRRIAVLSLNYNEISRIDCLIDELACHIKNENKNDFEYAKTVIKNMLKEISRLEKLSADGIF